MTSAAAGPAPIHVEKLMSLSRAEFEKSVVALAGEAAEIGDGRAVIRMGEGRVEITFNALPAKRLGGVLLLPQARVVVDVSGLDEASAVEFLQRFDLAFQRGGG
ncbi:MAG: hypothetical protein JNM89_09370 [Hyphomicrobiaceae bacterium]|nr:hypothetical protein [Hyphomicrobiaceae bacterium]